MSFSIYYVYQKNRQNPFIEVLISSSCKLNISNVTTKDFLYSRRESISKIISQIFLNIELQYDLKLHQKIIFLQNKALFKFILQLFYEFFSLGLFDGKKTIIQFCNIKDSLFEIKNKERKRIY